MHKQKKYKAATPGVAWLLTNLQIESPYGREALKELQPAGSNAQILNNTLDELSLTIALIRQNPDFIEKTDSIFKGLRNIGGSLNNLAQSLTPDETELLEIKNFAILLTGLSSFYNQSGLKLASIQFDDIQPVITVLNPDSVIISSFHIHEAYSETLKQIRAEKKKLESAILKETNQAAKDSLRKNRANLVQLEKAEEFNVRSTLGKQLQNWLPQLRNNATMVGKLELLLAKAKLALSWPACRPQILPGGSPIQVKEAINPQIVDILAQHGKTFTPVTIEITKGATLVTGANMGGKTVALMTIAMNAELAMLGFFVFAREFSIPPLDFIYLVAGDSQNQMSGLSSFGAEIIRLNEFIAHSNSGKGLAVFDEFARSTNPYEGSRFVQALSEYLQQSASYGIIATHYDGISLQGASCYQVTGLKNKHVTPPVTTDRSQVLNNICDNMDYRLIKIEGSYEVPKDALNIATMLETDPGFLNILKKYYS